MKKAYFLVVAVFIMLSVCDKGYADNFFDNKALTMKIIDMSLSEGMITGHYGCIQKALYAIASEEKDAKMRAVNDKVAWYNAVNALRMLDSISRELSAGKDKKQVQDNIRSVESILMTIGKKSFGWDKNMTNVMYSKTRELIEARLKDVDKGCFGRK